MKDVDLLLKSSQVIQELCLSEFSAYVDAKTTPPAVYRGKGDIKLIVLGQDPTVNNSQLRKKVHVALLLNRSGGLKTYLQDICSNLEISLENNVYATNVLKNFFIEPPVKIQKKLPSFIKHIALFWIPLLLLEIEEYKEVPILTLGEPILNCLAKTDQPLKIRDFWGYESPTSHNNNFQCLLAKDNVLNREIFPFPHIHGLRHLFYREQFRAYITFVKTSCFMNSSR